MKTITLEGPAGQKFRFNCEDVVLGVAVNPELPKNFSDTANEGRTDRHMAWWGVPYVEIQTDDNPEFVECWKGNTRYDVRCLDGGAWDRPTCWGMFSTLAQALHCAVSKTPAWGKVAA